ncbi:Uncharacterised protein [Pseudomonas aeruginosa]|nr:Uncharacterised protein [Pseudomonas aeruginosa]
MAQAHVAGNRQARAGFGQAPLVEAVLLEQRCGIDAGGEQGIGQGLDEADREVAEAHPRRAHSQRLTSCAPPPGVGLAHALGRAEQALAVLDGVPQATVGEGHGGATGAAGEQAFADRQALPGFGVAQAVRRQAHVAGHQFGVEAGPGLLPAAALVQGGGNRQQFDLAFDQGGVGIRVPAVGADQDAQATGRGIQHLQAFAAAIVEEA